MKKVRINTTTLKKRCLDPIEAFYDLGELIWTKDGPLVYIDRGAPVLAVAHLDTVFDTKRVDHFGIVKGTNTNYVVCPHLDDRLGAYIIIDLLPQLGINVDVVLTDGEEHGRSTGGWFDPPKGYNWMVEFDRRGDDVVLYDYWEPDLEALLESYDFKVATGSFSDISFMEHLSVKGINIGCGYHSAHTNMCYADLRTTVRQVRKFARFYNDNKEEFMPHIPDTNWWRHSDDGLDEWERHDRENDRLFRGKDWSLYEDFSYEDLKAFGIIQDFSKLGEEDDDEDGIMDLLRA